MYAVGDEVYLNSSTGYLAEVTQVKDHYKKDDEDALYICKREGRYSYKVKFYDREEMKWVNSIHRYWIDDLYEIYDALPEDTKQRISKLG